MTYGPCATLGAVHLEEGATSFRVWAPRARSVEVRLLHPAERVVPLVAAEGGYHEATIEGVEPGALYLYRLDGALERPDPASRLQPRGVHGPSQVVPARVQPDVPGWRGLPLEDLVLYELHVGTFTPAGTFDAVVEHLDGLRALGVTALELMPVAQFPGERNWGYDGVYPWAVQASYGGPEGLRRLVAACHARGLAVVLDVVMNHFGPEGCYQAAFGPYFTDRYRTPWGQALNFDGPGSDEVRRYFIEHAVRWLVELHLDGLRIDAVHEVHDESALPFLEELATTLHDHAARLGRRFHLIAESDRNDPRVVLPPEQGGLGHDAHWADDLHHALHAALTGERAGYYQDYAGLPDLAAALGRGYALAGRRSAFRGRRHGRSPERCAPRQLVVCAQNHDQVGNRARGDRLSALLPLEARKLAAAAVLLSPCTPLLFMGEEYGETAPFPYFTSHGDPGLVEAVRRGRRLEFAAVGESEEVPDPQDPATFRSAVLRRELAGDPPHGTLRAFYQELLALRRELAARLRQPLAFEDLEARADEAAQTVVLRRGGPEDGAVVVLAFAPEAREITLDLAPGRWVTRLDSSDRRWLGPGSQVPARLRAEGRVGLVPAPRSCLVLLREASA